MLIIVNIVNTVNIVDILKYIMEFTLTRRFQIIIFIVYIYSICCVHCQSYEDFCNEYQNNTICALHNIDNPLFNYLSNPILESFPYNSILESFPYNSTMESFPHNSTLEYYPYLIQNCPLVNECYNLNGICQQFGEYCDGYVNLHLCNGTCVCCTPNQIQISSNVPPTPIIPTSPISPASPLNPLSPNSTSLSRSNGLICSLTITILNIIIYLS